MERTTVELSLSTKQEDWDRVDGALEVLQSLSGVERLTIVRRSNTSRFIDVELQLVADDKPGLVSMYDKVSRLAQSTPPLQLRGRRCVLTELFD